MGETKGEVVLGEVVAVSDLLNLRFRCRLCGKSFRDLTSFLLHVFYEHGVELKQLLGNCEVLAKR